MKKLYLAATLLLLAPSAMVAQQKRSIVPEDLYRLKTASEATLSPDGKWVVYVQTSIDSAGNRYVRDLWTASSDGRVRRRLTWNPQSNEGSPVFSPDGRSLAFIARREGDEHAAEIYVLPFTEPGEARRVTTLARGTSRPIWSPDGSRLVFTVADSITPDTSKSNTRTGRLATRARSRDPIVLDRFDYVDEQSFRDERWSQI